MKRLGLILHKNAGTPKRNKSETRMIMTKGRMLISGALNVLLSQRRFVVVGTFVDDSCAALSAKFDRNMPLQCETTQWLFRALTLTQCISVDRNEKSWLRIAFA
jgi:hypothetical protein